MILSMFQIKDLLEKFKLLKDPKQIRQGVCDVLNKETNMNFLKEDMINVQRNILWIKSNPAIRQKIFIQKALCLEVLKQNFPEESIIDIK